MPLLKSIQFERWRFLELTLFMILYWIAFPFFESHGLVMVLTQLFFLNSLLVTLSAERSNVLIKRFVWTLWSLSVIGSVVNRFAGNPEYSMIGQILQVSASILLFSVAIFSILSFVFRSRRITVDMIMGALAAYLLIAYVFGGVYIALMLSNPRNFILPAAGGHSIESDMVYFSLVTIATLGYGDILPATYIARSIAVIEAVVGQFYVAVVVAILVGIMISQRFAPKQNSV